MLPTAWGQGTQSLNLHSAAGAFPNGTLGAGGNRRMRMEGRGDSGGE